MNNKNTSKNKSLKDQKQFFIDNIAKFCDKCGKEYSTDNIEILQQNEYSTIIHFSCDNCKARQMATFIRSMGITSRMPVNTDLSISEISKFSKRGRVSSNNVLDMHEMLKKDEFSTKDLLENIA